MTDSIQACLPAVNSESEAGVIRVKLERKDVEVDTAYCGEQNWEQVDTVGSLEKDPLAEDEAKLAVAIDTIPNISAVTTCFQNDFAKTEYLEETFESVPVLERDAKVFAGDALPNPQDNEPPTKKTKTKAKLKKVKPGICVKCNIGFPSTDLLEHHLSTAHQDERPYSCRHCGKGFQTLPNCRRHESIHNPKRWQGEPQFQCDLCPKRYHLKQSLDVHRKKVHFGYRPPYRPANAPVKEHHSTSGTRNPSAYRKPKEEHPCSHCDLKFDMRCQLNKHLTCHTKERPFPCPICQQPFPRQTLVKTHIRNVHEKPTPTGMHHPTPKWQAGKPRPCSVCGKVFKAANQLRTHMTLHTGELPYACDICGKRFRLKDGLNRHNKNKHRADRGNNPLKLYKCLICGKDNFTIFSCFRSHRLKRHASIPYESEKEKSFACGVCGKPYYLREDAIICARLKHDPSSLLQAMFKFKCPECPEDMLGFRNLSVLRKHWAEVHGDKALPTKLRQGMYDPNVKGDELPRCKVDKKTVQMWKDEGIPPEVVKSENPWFIELPLLAVPEEERFKRKKGRGKSRMPKIPQSWECDLCGLQVSKYWNLTRHKKVAHNPLNAQKESHQLKRKVGRPRKSCASEPLPSVAIKTEMEEEGVATAALIQSTFRCRLCSRTFASVRAVRTHELRKHVKPWSNKKEKNPQKEISCGNVNVCKTVNVRDAAGIAAVLNYQTVRVCLFKWTFPQGMLDTCKTAWKN